MARVDLKVARLPVGTWISLPVFILHGARPGPTVWLSAALHGDELNGVVVIRRLLADLDPAVIAGTVLAVPVANAFGATAGSRYLPDGRDLNRCFPGSKRGSLASRLAHLLFNSVVIRCSFGIDLHTGSGGRFNLPQIRCDADDPETRRLGESFGAPVLLHSPLRDDSLRAESGKRGIRVLLYEAGEANRLDPKCIRVGEAGVRRALRALGVLSHSPRAESPTQIFRKSVWQRAPRSGFFHATVRCGQRVRQGQNVGVVFDTTNATAWVQAKVDGVVIGERRTAVVHRGDAVLHIATDS
jgi:predicted deacylase